MRSPRLTVATAAAVGLLVLSVAPATAATAVTPATCFAAQQQLAVDRNALGTAESADAVEDNPVTGAADFTPDANDQAVANDKATVSVDQGNVNALCGAGSNPVGDPTPIPDNPPVQVIYRMYDGARVPCHLVGGTWVPVSTYEVVNGRHCHLQGGTWVPVTPPVDAPAPCAPCSATSVTAPPPVVYAPAPPQQVVTAPAPVTVYTPPAPSGPDFTQVGVVPAGAAPTGDGTLAGFVDPTPGTDHAVVLRVTLDLGNILDRDRTAPTVL